MMRPSRWIVPALLLVGLLGCGPPRKSVFPPTLSVQQLEVRADGSWRMQVRMQNNSYAGMKFQSVHLAMSVDRQPAGNIDANIDLDIPAFAADITTVDIRPGVGAAAALAAIADKGSSGSVKYTLQGTVSAVPDKESKPRSFDVSAENWFSAVPGIAHTFR